MFLLFPCLRRNHSIITPLHICVVLPSLLRDSSAGIYVYTGGETPEVGDGRLRNNEFFGNEFAVDYRAVKLTNCDDTVVTGEKGLCLSVMACGVVLGQRLGKRPGI